MIYKLKTEFTVQRSIADTFALFCDATNLETLTPPELRFRICTPLPIEMRKGARIEYRIQLFGVPFSWLTEITRWEPGIRFVDEQISGPFRLWVHEHRFEPAEDSSTRVRDEVSYSLPFGPIGRLGHFAVRQRLDRIFDFREERVHQLLDGASPRSESTNEYAVLPEPARSVAP